MLTRRALLGGAAILAAGCGGLEFSLLGLGGKQDTPVTWLSRPIPGLSTGPHLLTFEEELERILQNQAEDTESPFGPAPAGYSLALDYVENYAGNYSDPNAEQFRKTEHLAAWLEGIGADLVTLWHEEARALGDMGVLLPLDRFGGKDGLDFEREFFSPLLDTFRSNGSLYALPVDAFPLMLYYDADYFAQVGIAPPDGRWGWDDLLESALKLTQRENDGTVSRWGLASHGFAVWWALWQNEAELADAMTLRCRLPEPAAIEGLEYFRDLMHTHGVSPAVLGTDLWNLIFTVDSPPAMVYSPDPPIWSDLDYRRAEIPRGKVQSVPTESYAGIAIVSRTAEADVAYMALRGLVHAIQPHVNIPVEREALADIRRYQPDLQQNEIAAIQHSMDHARPIPHVAAQSRAMNSVVEGLVRGDDVGTVVNDSCLLLSQNMGA